MGQRPKFKAWTFKICVLCADVLDLFHEDRLSVTEFLVLSGTVPTVIVYYIYKYIPYTRKIYHFYITIYIYKVIVFFDTSASNRVLRTECGAITRGRKSLRTSVQHYFLYGMCKMRFLINVLNSVLHTRVRKIFYAPKIIHKIAFYAYCIKN